MKYCPHCLSTDVISDEEYLLYCKTCCRYELRPLPVVMPMTNELKQGGKNSGVVMVTMVCKYPKCRKKFRKRSTSKAELCPNCRNNALAAAYRNRRKKKEVGKVQQL